MKVIEPSVEYWKQENPIEHACRAAQISYQSEPKKGEAAQKFYNGLISSGHLSCLRHESCYFIVRFKDPADDRSALLNDLEDYALSPYIETYWDNDVVYVATNAQFIHEHQNLYKTIYDPGDLKLDKFQVTPEEFFKECPDLMRYTFCLTTQISTTRELLRHSPQSCTELSTRYIKFGGKVEPSIVKPHWFREGNVFEYAGEPGHYGYSIRHPEHGYYHDLPSFAPEVIYLNACSKDFITYNNLLEHLKPQDARGLLPLDTMSKIVMTHSIREWRKIIDMRYYGTTGTPHPNIKIISGMVRDHLIKLGYDI